MIHRAPRGDRRVPAGGGKARPRHFRRLIASAARNPLPQEIDGLPKAGSSSLRSSE